MEGRKPLPTAVKIRNGNPGNRPLNHNEAKPRKLVCLPSDPPDWLGEYGTQEWHRVGPVLIQLGLLTEADLMAFTTYCMNVDMLIIARKSIKDDGMTISGGRDGRGTVKNPALATFTSATAAVRAFAAEFGMTPSSRSRIHLPGDDDEGSIDDLIGGSAMDDLQ